MKITKETIKKWYEDHETQVKTGIKVAEIALGVTAAIVIGKKLMSGKASIPVEAIPTTPDIPKDIRQLPQSLIDMGFEVYSDGNKFIEFANYSGKPQCIDLDIDSLHDVVDAIKDIDGFGENTRIQAMFNVYDLDQ